VGSNGGCVGAKGTTDALGESIVKRTIDKGEWCSSHILISSGMIRNTSLTTSTMASLFKITSIADAHDLPRGEKLPKRSASPLFCGTIKESNQWSENMPFDFVLACQLYLFSSIKFTTSLMDEKPKL
jgi:hypothetical protein